MRCGFEWLWSFYVWCKLVGRQEQNRSYYGPFTRYVILRVAHVPGMPGTFSPLPRFSDPDMHHGTCVTHVPWCMSGSLTSRFLWSRPRGKTFPAFPVQAEPAILRIWQEAHEISFLNVDNKARWESSHWNRSMLNACKFTIISKHNFWLTCLIAARRFEATFKNLDF